MRFFLIILLCSVLISCKDSSVIGKQLSGSDSLEINFNVPGTNNIDKTFTTSESKAINKLIHFVDSKPADANECSYDGNLMFFKAGKLLGDISFNYAVDECHYFIQNVNGTLSSTSMSNEAVNFLKSLAEGKGWY